MAKGFDFDRLKATGTCAACGGPTERPAWAEKQVCEKCGRVDETRSFHSPLQGFQFEFSGEIST